MTKRLQTNSHKTHVTDMLIKAKSEDKDNITYGNAVKTLHKGSSIYLFTFLKKLDMKVTGFAHNLGG